MFWKDKEKIDNTFLQWELKRIIDLIKFWDKKMWFLVILLWWLISYDISKIQQIIENNISNSNIIIFVILLLLYIIIFIELVSFLYPKTINTNSKPILFWWYISTLNFDCFLSDFKKLSKKDLEEKLLEQIHTNSKILNYKMDKIKNIIFLLIILVITNIIFSITNINI